MTTEAVRAPPSLDAIVTVTPPGPLPDAPALITAHESVD
jgi:hypothetical protein